MTSASSCFWFFSSSSAFSTRAGGDGVRPVFGFSVGSAGPSALQRLSHVSAFMEMEVGVTTEVIKMLGLKRSL